MRTLRLLILLFAGALVAQGGRAQSCSTTKADKTAIVQALRALYAGATVDMAKMHSVTAPNFCAFDGEVEEGAPGGGVGRVDVEHGTPWSGVATGGPKIAESFLRG